MVNHFKITLTGSAQLLGNGLNFGDVCRWIAIQGAPGNTHVAYVGGNQRTLTNTDYGWRIEAPVTSIPYAPSIIELGAGVISLNDLYVLGTLNEILYVTVVV